MKSAHATVTLDATLYIAFVFGVDFFITNKAAMPSRFPRCYILGLGCGFGLVLGGDLRLWLGRMLGLGVGLGAFAGLGLGFSLGLGVTFCFLRPGMGLECHLSLGSPGHLGSVAGAAHANATMGQNVRSAHTPMRCLNKA